MNSISVTLVSGLSHDHINYIHNRTGSSLSKTHTLLKILSLNVYKYYVNLG